MRNFTKYDVESAPEASKAILQGAEQQMGAIPGLLALMAESPQTLQGYNQLHQQFTQSSFDAEELTVVWQTINVEHNCHYCVPAHTAIAHSMKVDSNLTQALREGAAMPTAKLQALHDFTLSMVRTRGDVSDADLAAFYAAGYGHKQVLEVILGLSQKVISNYVNRVAKTPVDEMFQPYSWVK